MVFGGGGGGGGLFGLLRHNGRSRFDGLRVGELMIFLPFHASVLEPDFDLSLGEAEGVGDLDPTATRQISIEVKFLLQFQRLVTSVRLTTALPVCIGEGKGNEALRLGRQEEKKWWETTDREIERLRREG